MPRQKSEPARTERATLDHEVITADTRAMDADAPRRQEIVERYADGQPYDRLRVVNETRFYMAQGAHAMLEAGKRLIQIKEFEEHGDFLQIVDELGLSARTAQHMMGAAVKILAVDSKGREKLLALPPTKLYDLAILDDGDIKELAKGKTVAGISLDEIEAMGTRELRAHLREAQHQLEAKDKVLEAKNKKLDKLLEADAHKAPYEKQFADAIAAVSQAFDQAQLACAELARVAELVTTLEFDGFETDRDQLTLRAQIANVFYDRSEAWLEQGAGLMVAARSDHIEALLSLARKKLPEDVKAKLFGEGA